MKDDKYASTAEAVPVFIQEKETIWEIFQAAVRARLEYRIARNPLDLRDFANNTLALYDIIRMDIDSDRKLKKNYGWLVDSLDRYSISSLNPMKMNPVEWNKYFRGVQGVLYAMGVLRITMDKDTDDDFAGVPGMDEVYQNLMKNFGIDKNGERNDDAAGSEDDTAE